MQNRNSLTDTETRLVVASGEELGRVDWESRVSGCRLAHRDGKSKVPLWSTGSRFFSVVSV